ERDLCESHRRPRRVVVPQPGHVAATLRDQIPMHEAKLADCLDDGLVPADWYRILNRKVFFWCAERQVEKLLCARAYRDRPHLVLVVDTRRLIDAHRDDVRLAFINTGATLFNPARRGRSTF